jgi:hypothetical protein
MYLVLLDGHPKAAYPRKAQAEVYASGFSKPCEIVKVSVEGYDCLLTQDEPDQKRARRKSEPLYIPAISGG